MGKNKRNLVVLGAVLLVVIWAWSPGTARKKGNHTSFPEPPASDNIPRRVKSSFAEWGRNPFMLPGELSESLRGLMLDGIVWDDEKPYAIINNRVLGIGDAIGKSRITAITETAVTLEEDGNAFSIQLRNEKEAPPR